VEINEVVEEEKKEEEEENIKEEEEDEEKEKHEEEELYMSDMSINFNISPQECANFMMGLLHLWSELSS